MSQDLEFEKLLAEKQRNELNAVLKELSSSLLSSKEEQKLAEAVENLSLLIEQLITQTNKLQKGDGLGEDVVLFNAVEELKRYIKLSQVKKQWDISFERDEMGYLKSPITLTQKQ